MTEDVLNQADKLHKEIKGKRGAVSVLNNLLEIDNFFLLVSKCSEWFVYRSISDEAMRNNDELTLRNYLENEKKKYTSELIQLENQFKSL